MITKNFVSANPENGDEGDSNESFKVYKNVISTQYDVFLSKEVSSDLNSYFDLMQLLDHDAKQGDVVHIKLANYGGDLHSGIALAHAVKNCNAAVMVHAISSCYSMAAILALCGDGLIIYPGNYLMFHNYSGGEVGKAGEIETSNKANQRSWEEALKYFCHPFLTYDEIKSIMDDKDRYVHFNEKGLKQRLKRHFVRMTTQE